jgi:hypothetical protein
LSVPIIYIVDIFHICMIYGKWINEWMNEMSYWNICNRTCIHFL